MFAPAGTPYAVVRRLENEMVGVLQNDHVRKLMRDTGIEPELVGAGAFAKRIQDETSRYAEIIRNTGIRIDR